MTFFFFFFFFFSSRRRHTRWPRDWSSDVCSSDLVYSGDFRVERPYHHSHQEVAAVHAELFVRREGKAHFLSRRIADFSDHDVGWRIQLQCRRNQELCLAIIGIDVIPADDAKIAVNLSRPSARNTDDRCGQHGNCRPFWAHEVLTPSQTYGREQPNCPDFSRSAHQPQ